MENDNHITPLAPDDRFAFECGPKVRCFNECCRDLNQFLTPYDILRLKNSLGMDSGEFLATYTTHHTGPETGLPVVSLKADPAAGLTCPLVTPEGCRVYADRPASCRTYPLARLVSRSRETGKLTAQYVLLKEPHCLGFDAEKTWTAGEWIADQGLDIYNEMNDLLLEVISLKNRFRPGPLDITSGQTFYTACYDLDAFKTQAFEKGLLDGFSESPHTLEGAEKDETVLLKLGADWIKYSLFHKRP